ncbi:NAD(P)-binding oxidoreductase [Pricia sp. S334]|uniref:NAD(P)-binding oxidoreductase n=1 Tax=Pricia mediterranea TaxID=3076079 RepID=A0ABU3L8M0_9FLAO|nr:NAD(P)-binding oxidoreductase [Pricia sp. S334]MDT7829568.1 NAD(P)-binding oxidoreductase [Pricia sp. S334]
MTILVVGASGATGQHLVAQLLEQGQYVKAVVRSAGKLPESIRNEHNLSIIEASILNLSDTEMAEHVAGCDAIASCLGHNLTFKGIYGKPQRLVADAARRLCGAIKANNPEKPVKYVLMNTSGNRNRDLDEPISSAQRGIIALLRLLLPPHVDNEKAADFLRTEIGQKDTMIEWTAVRPDGLINESEVTEYEVHPSPIRSPIFDAGKVSRINVAHFMANLISNDDLWQKWKGQMPVIYSKEMSS